MPKVVISHVITCDFYKTASEMRDILDKAKSF